MMPGINPRDLNRIMKQLNAKQIDAERVIIKGKEKDIIIENPEVTQMGVGKNLVFQVLGNIVEQSLNEEDVKLVMEKTGKDKEEARKALEKNKGDIAQTIMELS
jgi:nascent polypeptide-associated complex subunit alpha